jgi:hypothetical protein
MPSGLSPEEEGRARLHIVRQIAADVAAIIAGVEPAEINGNVHLPKPPLVSALSLYFEEAGADRDQFVARCYRR